MSPTTRCMGGLTRPRDLRVITRSRGAHLETLSPDTHTPSARGHFVGPSRDSDSPHGLPTGVALHSAEVPFLGSARSPVDTAHLTRSIPRVSLASQQAHGFHTSSCVPYDSTSYNVTDVPDFFVKRKQHRASAGSEKHEELGLMQPLSDSILSGDLVATTRRLKTKVPIGYHAGQGDVVHPSGFVVPGPGHVSPSDVARVKEGERDEKKDRLLQTAAVARRVLESDLAHVDATTLPSLHKVPFEVREPDGTVTHASGFVPPTPSHKFRHMVNSSVLRDRKISAMQRKAKQLSPPARGVWRAIHTNASEEE